MVNFAELASRIRSLAPSCGPARLVAVDGPAGSGKTTFALALGEELGAQVVRSDDFPVPWDEGPGAWFPALERAVLVPLAAGRTGSFRRYDWVRDAYAEVVTVPPAPVLLIEGVGTARRSAAHLLAWTVWVEAPEPVRWRRVAERDGPGLERQWRTWFAAEREWFAADGTRERADEIVTTA
ncbi:uridine kinase family protein [Nonomuraea soli]|uniref:Uridine kinase n=1 Tax=Nonomuraea soli TaxID=1032476 RepID=A0A7W0HT30_9ACTN|nr:AAA family ATPase [Nonomuraea soli]MBA2894654.1 uridine kinase [Nonomuraea soli]